MTEETLIDDCRRWRTDGRIPTLAEFHEIYGAVFANYRFHWDAPFAVGGISHFYRRMHYIEEFGFSLPCAEALDALCAHAPILEVGAGTGYWSALMAARGVDVVASDAVLEKFSFALGRHFPLIAAQAKTAVRRYPDRNVFCSWPSLNHTWLRQAARAMRPGRVLIVVREDATADERTWDYVEDAFREVGTIELPCWYGMHDRVEIWKKRGRPPQNTEPSAQAIGSNP